VMSSIYDKQKNLSASYGSCCYTKTWIGYAKPLLRTSMSTYLLESFTGGYSSLISAIEYKKEGYVHKNQL
jgi:hypothetical protein